MATRACAVAAALLLVLLANRAKREFWLQYASQPENIHPGQGASYLAACCIVSAAFVFG